MAKPMIFKLVCGPGLRLEVTPPQGRSEHAFARMADWAIIADGNLHSDFGRRKMIVAALDVLLAMDEEETTFASAILDEKKEELEERRAQDRG